MSAVLPTRRAHERTREAVLWVEEERTRRDPEAPQDQVEPVWVLTTSATADASGDYPAVVSLYRAIDHTWEDLTAAVRVRGIAGESLTNATRYACRPAGVTAGGEDLYVLLSGSGSSLAVKEVDGSPSYSGVSTLRINQTDGLYVEAPGPAGSADVRLTAATRTQAGGVAVGNQNWSGTKQADAWQIAAAGVTSNYVQLGTLASGNALVVSSSAGGFVFPAIYVSSPSSGLLGGGTDDVYIWATNGTWRLSFDGGLFSFAEFFGGPSTGFTGVLG